MRLQRFYGTYDSECVILKQPYETGSIFRFQNTCGKVKSDFQNRFEPKFLMLHFFWITLYIPKKCHFWDTTDSTHLISISILIILHINFISASSSSTVWCCSCHRTLGVGNRGSYMVAVSALPPSPIPIRQNAKLIMAHK